MVFVGITWYCSDLVFVSITWYCQTAVTLFTAPQQYKFTTSNSIV